MRVEYSTAFASGNVPAKLAATHQAVRYAAVIGSQKADRSVADAKAAPLAAFDTLVRGIGARKQQRLA